VIYLALLAAGLGASVPGPGFRVPTGLETTVNPERGTQDAFTHDLHVSHTRMVLEGTTVACRIRLFKDDLEKALRLFSGQDSLHLTEKARADSLFGAYFGQKVTLEANGSRVALTVSASGTEHDQAAQEIVWYVLEGESRTPVSKLGLLNGLMFELFRDQQNIVQLLREPGNIRQTLYFVSTDPREQSISF
jgi:Domain of unknown function (DUF6702)